jgi:hypothetical protein
VIAMVRVQNDGKQSFICEICGLIYEDRFWAEKCEKYCEENNACSLEITRHAIKEKKHSYQNMDKEII